MFDIIDISNWLDILDTFFIFVICLWIIFYMWNARSIPSPKAISLKRAHGLFQNATEKGQISHAPNFNQPSILFRNPEITPILHELVTLSALPVAGIEVDFAVDSTGFRTTQFSAYNGMKHGQKKEHHWVKAHLCAGVKTNVVAAVAITDENGGDSPQFGPLVKT